MTHSHLQLLRNKTPFFCPSKKSGFTLIELILVMGLLVVIMSVAAPSLSGFFRGRTLENEARRFLAMTRHGQSRAVSEGFPMVLWIDPATGFYGLRAHESYLPADSNAVEFQLSTNVQFIIDPVRPIVSSNSLEIDRSAVRHSGIHFSPDGSIGPTSLPTIHLQRDQKESLWIVQTFNRLRYEVRHQTNTWIPPQP